MNTTPTPPVTAPKRPPALVAEFAPPSPANGAASAGAHLSVRDSEALVRLVETAPAVLRRSQFFVWSQGPLSALLPHQVLVCGAYSRAQRRLSFTAFQSVVLPAPALQALTDSEGSLLEAAAAAWVRGGARAMALDAERLPASAQGAAGSVTQVLGKAPWLLHGVARPQRPNELESFFLLLGMPTAAARAPESLLHLERLMPYLHATWRNVEINEILSRPRNAEVALMAESLPPVATPNQPLTDRERQILRCAREGQSNQEIGLSLGISALTVKNHIQKILRKLNASNRAHAVAMAMSRGLL
jgi:transcriptional regulator EpsA